MEKETHILTVDLRQAFSRSEVKLVLEQIPQVVNRSLAKAMPQKINLEDFIAKIKASKYMTCQIITSLITKSQLKV